jgi:hypothetical protein
MKFLQLKALLAKRYGFLAAMALVSTNTVCANERPILASGFLALQQCFARTTREASGMQRLATYINVTGAGGGGVLTVL